MRVKHESVTPSRSLRLPAACALLVAPLLIACGDYDAAPGGASGGTGGQSTATGMLAGGGSAAVGPAGSAGQAGAAGGSSLPAGSGGSGGSAVAGGGSAGTGASTAVTPVEASCAAVQPCGGNVVGSWVSAGSCLPVSGMVDVSGFGLGCTAAPVTGMLEVTGTWTANADGTFTDQTTTSGSSQLELGADCLNISGTVTTCDRLGGALQALGYSDATCADAASGGGCSCTASVHQTGGLAMVSVSPAASGTYTTANDVVTTAAGGSNNAYAYCATEDTLVMTPQTTAPTGTVTGTIVLSKP